MNIIICGAGKVGFSISKQLSAQGHSVTVIDQSSDDIKKINETSNDQTFISWSLIKGNNPTIKKTIKKTTPKLLLEPILISSI